MHFSLERTRLIECTYLSSCEVGTLMNHVLSNLRSAFCCISSFYRPPDSNINESLQELERQLFFLNVNTFNFDLLMMGDMNVDLSKSSNTARHLGSFLS